MRDCIPISEPLDALERPGRRRGGVTLVELLIVMAVVVLLAGLTLPTVRTLLKDQRTSQAARVVQGFIESARARAIASNRPVAVIFERIGQTDSDLVTLQTCTQISIGEVFPPYEGDWVGTKGTLVDTDFDQFFDAIDIPAAQGAILPTVVTDGDTIEIGTQRLGFSIIGTPTASSTNYRVLFRNPNRSEKRLPKVNSTTNASFRIYRKPSKTMTGTVVLPRGTCIDLGWSGIGPSGTNFASSTLSNTLSGSAKRSIYVVFNAAGSVEFVYEFQQNASGSAVVALPSALGLIHFMVGRIDQVNLPPMRASERDQVKANVVDPANNWVSINAFTGRVYSSDVAATSEGSTADVAGARYLATQGVNKKGT